MRRLPLLFALLLVSAAVAQPVPPASDPWQPVATAVDYQHFLEGSMDIHVTRIDLTSEAIRIISTRQSDVGTRVSEFGTRTHALVAINGDYFDEAMKPVGLAIGPCGTWTGTKDTSREGVAAFGPGRGEISPQAEVMETPGEWIGSAVSGWPMIVKGCHALTSAELPGSDSFTRSQHARTAVGLSADGRTAYFVVADGRRADAPGLTLGQLAAFFSDRLGVCSAINFDGGGSTAMWLKDHIVNRPSDGTERRVANHLAVVAADEQIACDATKEQKAGAALLAASAKLNAAAQPTGGDAKATITLTTSAPPGPSSTAPPPP